MVSTTKQRRWHSITLRLCLCRVCCFVVGKTAFRTHPPTSYIDRNLVTGVTGGECWRMYSLLIAHLDVIFDDCTMWKVVALKLTSSRLLISVSNDVLLYLASLLGYYWAILYITDIVDLQLQTLTIEAFSLWVTDSHISIDVSRNDEDNRVQWILTFNSNQKLSTLQFKLAGKILEYLFPLYSADNRRTPGNLWRFR